MNNEKGIIIPEEVLMSKIYLIRGKKVMLDRDLALLYEVETKRLKEQVRRNKNRFPIDFMFELSKEELNNWRSQFATSNREIMGLRRPPFAFTEHGVLMLSSVLKSQPAIIVNIQIMRIFVKLRTLLLNHKELLIKMGQIEQQIIDHGDDIHTLFEYINALMKDKEAAEQQASRKKIGFKK